ncbi:MAG: DMT family transporter [Ardenticatenaceae bacterium]|nr:DMT family transporter [Ardenticatenaceae bacterium]
MSRPSHIGAVAQALLVTILWASSWVLIKFGLRDIPALTFAGLRYTLAFIILLAVSLSGPHRAAFRRLPREAWLRLAVLGLLLYSITQGAQFLGLALLPATTASLILSFTTVCVALLAIPLLGERPGWHGWMGVVMALAGAVTYFYPATLAPADWLGLLIVSSGMLSGALAAILGRGVARRDDLTPSQITTVSMGVGSLLLLGSGLAVESWPHLTLSGLVIIGWLALVNTALAFTLWVNSQRTLSAVESSILNNLMLPEIALLAWLFLGEHPAPRQWLGIGLVIGGTLVVQLRRRPAAPQPMPAGASAVRQQEG